MEHDSTAEDLFAPEGYITLKSGIQRTVDSTSYDFAGPLPEYRSERAWASIRAALHAGKICGTTLKDDGSLVELPASFWGSRDAGKLGVDEDRIDGQATFDFDGRAFISERDFERTIERFVFPLPASETPQHLIFISQTDEQGVAIPLTYMLLSDVLDAYAEQRRARIDETESENWRASQESLRASLEAGSLRSYHRNRRGLVRPLRSTDWRIGGPILARIFRKEGARGYGEERHSISDDWISTIDVQTEKGAQHGEILIPSQEVYSSLRVDESHLPSDNVSSIKINAFSTNDGNPDNSVDVPGRPREHDREMFCTVAFKILWEEGKMTQAELIRRAVPAYQSAREEVGAKGPPPGETWVKERVRLLWRRLGFNGTSS